MEANDVVVSGNDYFFNVSLLFNTSLKLAHRVISLPSRALARLRRLDEMALDFRDSEHASQDVSAGPHAYRRHRHLGNGSDAPPMPSPWGFITSGYFIGLFVMAFVLNRIQNLVVPPRRPLAFRFHHNHTELHNQRPVTLRRALLRVLFPVDFSSTLSRTMFRVPSIYLLVKAVMVWVSLLLLAQGPPLFTRVPWLQPLGDWVAKKAIEDICWYTFMSTCFALCVGTLTTGLEGLNMNESAPFNLFVFAYQLYVESAASRPRPQKEGEPDVRPNVHVIITILLPLLQLTVMHCLEIQHKWSRWRLAFSSVGSMLALFHFHYVVWLSPFHYPLTTYGGRVVESIMLAIIAVTVALNATTQLLAEGSLCRPLFGHSALMPGAHEDFIVALFRLGTASMEATAVAGLGNEVGGVLCTRPAATSRASQREPARVVVRGTVEFDRTGVSGLQPAYERRGMRRVTRTGLANEIATVKATAASTDFWMDTVLNVAWQRHLGAFLLSAWRAGGRLWRCGVAKLRGMSVARERSPSVAVVDGPPPSPRSSGEAEADPYERFLRGESVSDGEDSDFQPEEEGGLPQGPWSGSDEEEEEDGADGEEGEEQAQLYADLSKSGMASAPLLLAHMTDASSSPLTRRGYRRLVSGTRRASTEAEEWEEFVQGLRHAKRDAMGADDGNPRVCVICTVEARDIICWPCRCLALCDDCRYNLASRSSASKHTCPCCRQSVEGYTKIYIP